MKFQSSLFLTPLAIVSPARGSTIGSGDICPFLEKQREEGLGGDGSFDAAFRLKVQQRARELNTNKRSGHGATVPEGGYKAVRAEIAKVLTNSQSFWPADFGNYGGFFIRLAWHCAGSYRQSDGRGGCDGGRIRFAPELEWPDNANLNFALQLLEPVKAKFGSSLSWGDLIILAGNTAIETMGGPVLGFCGGRIDDDDGSDSLILGPSDLQEEITPCTTIGQQGHCTSPLGPTTVGLIYVNPGGPEGATGDAAASGVDIHDAFGRMGFTSRETVALIGGGHAFGKCHGACPNPPCGQGTDMEGKGPNTFTSGFEGAWTSQPTTWTNEYFNNLANLNWSASIGPGGNLQWFTDNEDLDIMMLTSDIAMIVDPIFRPISLEFASDISVLNEYFATAWYHLVTGDMGPTSRCLGDEVPKPQYWQDDLETASSSVPDFIPIRASIQALIDEDSSNIAAFAKLAWGCARTYRETDYRGGCNGARIRFSPEKDWPMNAGASATLAKLEVVKTDDISYGDLIVLAGQTAIEAAGGNAMPFCGARVDVNSGQGSELYAPVEYPNASDDYVLLQHMCFLKGLTNMECAATFAIPTADTLSNQYFVDLKAGNGDFSAMEKALLVENGDYLSIVDSFIADNDKFLTVFAEAWTKMMTADRHDGPIGNYCDGKSHVTLETAGNQASDGSDDNNNTVGLLVTVGLLFGALIAVCLYCRSISGPKS